LPVPRVVLRKPLGAMTNADLSSNVNVASPTLKTLHGKVCTLLLFSSLCTLARVDIFAREKLCGHPHVQIPSCTACVNTSSLLDTLATRTHAHCRCASRKLGFLVVHARVRCLLVSLVRILLWPRTNKKNSVCGCPILVAHKQAASLSALASFGLRMHSRVLPQLFVCTRSCWHSVHLSICLFLRDEFIGAHNHRTDCFVRSCPSLSSRREPSRLCDHD
jgi:hypothetical protein